MQWFINAVNELKGSDKDNWIHNITNETLLSDLDLDSLDVVELQMMYEDDANVVLSDPDENFYTVGDLLSLMK